MPLPTPELGREADERYQRQSEADRGGKRPAAACIGPGADGRACGSCQIEGRHEEPIQPAAMLRRRAGKSRVDLSYYIGGVDAPTPSRTPATARSKAPSADPLRASRHSGKAKRRQHQCHSGCGARPAAIRNASRDRC